MAGGIFAPPDLAAELAGLHVRTGAQDIDQSRLSCAAGTGQNRGLSSEDPADLFEALRYIAADKKDSTPTGFVGLSEF